MAILIMPIPGVPAIQPGDDLGEILVSAIEGARVGAKAGDILVVCQKVVSKAEGRVVALSSVEPSPFAAEWAARHEKDPRVVELVLRESKRIVRMDRGNLIVETGPGWVCANAGIDQSNALAEDTVTLLPLDPDASAERLRATLGQRLGVDIAVIVTDTFGRPWREGQVEFALGVAGLAPLDDLRGKNDLVGRELGVTVIGTADQLACAAGLAMRKDAGLPAILIRGHESSGGPADGRGGRALIRPSENDLFR